MPTSSEDQPITTKHIVKWGSISVSILAGLISAVSFVNGLKSDIAHLTDEIGSMRTQMEMKNTQQDKDLDLLRLRADSTDKSVSDLNRKLDVAVAILERIDRKVGAN